jgi:hypothetical protein
MNMAKCDICGNTASIHDMESLRDCYQLPHVKDMCRTCSKWADKQLDEVRAANAGELKRRIAARVANPRHSIWRRLFKSNPKSEPRL